MDFTLANARILCKGNVLSGRINIRNGIIYSITTGNSVPLGAVDCEGDYICPGLIELHTDNLERHIQPRPGVNWPLDASIIAHDRELAGTGITTVFDAVRVGSITSNTAAGYDKYARETVTKINRLVASQALKISHYIHLRAEICSETLIEEVDEFTHEDRLKMISIMDHTPGQRQFRDEGKLVEYLSNKNSMNDQEIAEHFQMLKSLQTNFAQIHRNHVKIKANSLNILLASHDDTSLEDVVCSAEDGCTLAEFPTTLEAAKFCREYRISIMMGTPNLVRGVSHSGNISARELASKGLIDILSSDYIPSSLLMGAVKLGLIRKNLALGLQSVTQFPAEAAGLEDRGTIEVGKRADLLRFCISREQPKIKTVWCEGIQIA